jgi:ABC-type uncharacterized transport system involved in gliding motility auxiliary subunit
MSKAGKFLFLFSVLFFMGLCVFRLIYGGWHDAMWVPFTLSLVLFFVGFIKEYRAIMAFFTMRTTKHGMNMFTLILMVLVGLTCVNVLAVHYEKTFDWTSEKLNSLSDQSIKAAKSLKQETQLLLLYRDEQKQGENVQRGVRDLANMYLNQNAMIKFSAYNALQRPDLAEQYEYKTGPFAFYAIQGAQKVQIDQPTEEGVTHALMKFGRDHKKIIYFVMGHGERDLNAKDEDGLSDLKDDLLISYEVKPLILYQSGNKIPDDADEVAIVRPQQQYLETELQALRDYAKGGGHLFIALDPGLKQNLAQLTKTLGVEFDNDFILDLRSQVIKSGPATVLGSVFSKTNDITKAFDNGMYAIFFTASSVKRAPDAPSSIQFDDIVQTDQRTMAIAELKDQVTYKPNGPHTLGVWATGRLSGQTEATQPKPFSAVVFGDSDFISNRIFHDNLNRDLSLNAFSSLANDKDLVSIRAKEPKATKLEMTTQGFMILLLGFLLPLPLAMFLTGGVAWWRRRVA